MKRSMVVVSALVAALGSGVALAKGSGMGTGPSGGSMHGSNHGMGSHSAHDGLQTQQRNREQVRTGYEGAGSGGIQKRTQEQLRIQEKLQP